MSVHVQVAGRYRLKATLSTLHEHYEGVETDADVDAGDRELTAFIDSSELRQLAVDGPYNIGLVEISHPIPEGRGVDYFKFDAGLTHSYRFSDLAP